VSEIYKIMKKLNKTAAKELIFENECFNGNALCPLLFYQYKTYNREFVTYKEHVKNLKIREQELKFAMVYLLNTVEEYDGYLISVDTPTVKKYNFSGTNAQIAQTDMIIYDGGNHVNIEFMANNPKQNSINNCIEKLLREESEEGAWCHIFKDADDKTWKSLFDKIKKAFEVVFNNHDDIEEKPIYFSFIVMSKKMFYRKQLTDISKYNDFFNDSIDTWKKWHFNNRIERFERV
jgi:hypothetical protein